MLEDENDEIRNVMQPRVVLKGLCSRPELNGRAVRICSFGEDGRVGVLPLGEDATISVKAARLEVAEAGT